MYIKEDKAMKDFEFTKYDIATINSYIKLYDNGYLHYNELCKLVGEYLFNRVKLEAELEAV